MKGKLKRRWPLKSAYVYIDEQNAKKLIKHKELLEKFCNVKEIFFVTNIEKIPIELLIKPNYELLGKKLKSNINEFRKIIKEHNSLSLFNHFYKNDIFELKINDTIYEILKKEINFSFIAKENFVLSEKSGFIVILPQERDDTLFIEGYLRDLARRIQSERKESGLDPTEILKNTLIYGIEEDTRKLLIPKLSELKYLVRTKNVEVVDDVNSESNWKDIDIDGKKLKICIISF